MVGMVNVTTHMYAKGMCSNGRGVGLFPAISEGSGNIEHYNNKIAQGLYYTPSTRMVIRGCG